MTIGLNNAQLKYTSFVAASKFPQNLTRLNTLLFFLRSVAIAAMLCRQLVESVHCILSSSNNSAKRCAGVQN